MLGLTLPDWAVLVVYVGAVTALGLYVSRRVRGTGDYFMGGRRFGRALMIAQAFGTGTRTDQVVAVSGGAAQVGLAAIWFQWLYLFSTPFFWLLAPVYRRMRYLTIGDFFEQRYGSSMGAAYAVVGLLYFAVTTGVMLRGAGVTIEGISGGAIPTAWAVLAMVAFFLVYSLAGGLVAAVTTQAVQGVFILILSFLLIPFALLAVGGLGGAREALPEGPAWFSLVATEEVTLFYIVMAIVNALVGVTVQPHHMAINGAGKDEIACRTGWTYGNFVKRFATLGWALTGVFVAASFPGLTEAGRGEREAAFGLAARELLPPGFAGLLVAAAAAAVVAGATSFMTGGSALFTRNFYRRYLRPAASEAELLRTGRLASVAVVAVGVAVALGLESVIAGLEWIWKLMAFLGLAFWAALFWRRANRWGAWASLVVTAACAFTTDALGWSFPAQVALYLPAGALALWLGSLLTRPEPEARLNAFYSLLNTPVGEEARLYAAGVPVVHEAGEATVAEPPGPSDAPTPLLDDAPAAARGERLLLTRLLALRGTRLADYRVDLRGFGYAWGLVFALLALAWGLAAMLRI